MTLPDLAALPTALHLHLWPALLALLLGPVALTRRRRDVRHKVAGYIWVTAMALTAASAFWLEAAILPLAFGFGPIHALSVLVLYGLWRGVSAARAGDVAAHSGWMRGLYWQALIVAGTFTLLPGRTLNTLIFGDRPSLGAVVIVGIALAIALRIVRGRRARPAAG
ncbi:DUF2306 domain-containing protein [Roseicyclus mahoneyensis]|jgi:uncharacterized membrane protein|uniref:Putative membrane protein n=1 Tax=Roseicyclus mahoneyensis TaxID=164332 RepID=A0A316GJA3_9RHOB|nr:DUF2306 domain-containing protein [Roseicyclus mahoneyensis]PWK61187.1 putative membrane protein [Roseicyclus mahoneyensis]